MPSKLRRILGLALILTALGIAISLFLNRSSQDGSPADRRASLPRGERSILLITVDTTRADHLQPYGAENIATPALQTLADRGILFERASSVAPITLVAHTSILSGRYPPSHGVRNNGLHYVPQDVTTMAEILRDEGYRTGAFVAASVLEKRYGLDQGFEVYDDDLSAGRERHPRMVADRPAEAVVDSTLAWIDSLEAGDKYFAWVHFYDPHAAYSPPAPFRDDYRENLYNGEIAYMDDQIGRLLRHPRVTGEDDAIVTVIGDHGESFGEHGEQTHALLAYDSTLRIPWILRVPGGASGARIGREVSQVDLMPTLLDLLEVDFDEEAVQGRSLVPVLADPRGERENPLLYSETYLPYYTYGWAKLRSARRGIWKYIDGPEPELFDLRRDPHELSNQIEQNPGIAHDMARDLDEMLATLGEGDNEATLSLDTDAAEKLRSLGYLSVGSGTRDDAIADDERPDPKKMIGVHVSLERARQLLRDRLFDQASPMLRQALRKDPTNLAILLDLAQALEGQGEIEEAIQAAEKALEIDPRYSRIHLMLAGFEADRGETGKALELLNLALDLDPRSIEATLQKAYLLRRLKRNEEVRGMLAASLEQHPDHPRILSTYAQLVDLPAGDLETAEQRLRAALERDPFLTAGWRQLGETLQRGGRMQEAADAYREGLKRAADDADLHARLGTLLAKMGGESGTEKHLREAVRLAREMRPEVHIALGGWLAENGRLEDAQREYDRVLEQNPRHPGARNNRAVALFLSGNAAEALALLKEVTAEFPNHPDANSNLAALAVGQRDWKLAEKHARKALELNAENADAWNNLGVTLEETGRYDASREAYAEALQRRPDDWRAHFNLGILERKSERWEAAVEALRKTVELMPQHAETHWELGRIYADPLDDADRARTHLNVFLRIAPGDPRAEEARKLVQSLSP